MALKRLSKTFYKVSYIISIIYIVLVAISMISLGVTLATLLSGGEFVLTDGTGNALDSNVTVALLVVYEVVLLFVLGLTITNLVVSKKAYNNPNKKLHILGIVFGVLSGVEFSVPAGILGLIALKYDPKENVVDVESTSK